jgi:hypothetical protein
MNAFKIIHELTRPGGYMIHDVPWEGLCTHGFFHYTPTFFWALSGQNEYRWHGLWLRRQKSRQSIPEAIPLRDGPREFDLDDGMILSVMQKTADRPFRLPIDVGGTLAAQFQGHYA